MTFTFHIGSDGVLVRRRGGVGTCVWWPKAGVWNLFAVNPADTREITTDQARAIVGSDANLTAPPRTPS
ncbi:MAG: hypothetical protein ACLQMH_13470 [Solirubrobacteraceae bacterium]